MTKYICSNCGYLQDELCGTGNDAQGFWVFSLIITFIIALFVPVAWIVVGFEILFCILTGGKLNSCRKCKAKDCMLPIDTPKGEKLFNEFYEYENEDEDIDDNIKEDIVSPDINANNEKIKIQKYKSWKELAKENKVSLILSIIGFGFLFLWALGLALLPMLISSN